MDPFGFPVGDPKSAACLRRIEKIPSLARGPICFPDLHLKSDLEAPTSLAVATRGTLVPHLSTSTPGDGIGVITTDLSVNDLRDDFFRRLLFELQREFALEDNSLLTDFLVWLGFRNRPFHPYDLSLEELRRVVRDGPRAVKGKSGMHESFFSRNALPFVHAPSFSLREILPRAARIGSLHQLGFWLGGNSFIEFLLVDRMMDEAQCRTWGLAPGKILVMYHGGEGSLGFYVGRYFSRRKKYGRREEWLRFPAKFGFHFFSLRGLRHARARWRYYFRNIPFQEIPLTSVEGWRAYAAFYAALHYSYVSRIILAKRLGDCMSRVAGRPVTEAFRLLWDASHNSISEEVIEGVPLVVHRNGASRVVPGEPVVVSGSNQSRSYLGVGLSRAARALYSADHGVGTLIQRFLREGKSREIPGGGHTEVFRVVEGTWEKKPYISDEALDFARGALESGGITRPVALLRPIATYK